MVERIILGKRGASEFGCWVSRPGFSALTDPLPMLSTSAFAHQVIIAGTAALPLNTDQTMTVNYGQTFPFIPVVYFNVYTVGAGGGVAVWPFTQFFNNIKKPVARVVPGASSMVVTRGDDGTSTAFIRYWITKVPRGIA